MVPPCPQLFWFNVPEIDFDPCLIQMFFIHVFTFIESGILFTMVFDHYVTVFNPLRQTTVLMNSTIDEMDSVTVLGIASRKEQFKALTCVFHNCAVLLVCVLLLKVSIIHHCGKHVPPMVHIIMDYFGYLSVTTCNYTSTHFTAFLLTGVPGLEDFQFWISIPFSFMYFLAMIGNGLVMAVVVWDRNLHEPMYIFLAMLAINDVLLCTVIVPKMLLIFWQGPSLSTFPACLTQMFFVHALFLSESAVLLAMAFDRYVAICAPLHYATLLTGSLISKVALTLVARSVAVVTPGVLLILRLHFCQSNVIHHTYCENMGIAKLACNSITLNSIYGLTAALLTTGLDFVFISMSYWVILRTIFQLPSWEARTKAFGTCGAHICVILIFYTLAFFSFFTHRFGNHVPRHALILLANLYLLVPPTMNPIIYGVKTKVIRMRVLGFCNQPK
ncbi:olfactory receptor 52Z1-like [Pteropus vampyrus]|uniref:Olfactory receptor 52Z1-like n=1 Tax=Pteropus vampyrus TaxID=132908 RepID=A0A6P3RLJ0_PTEVA|nr:olfactory receptor 52Z1-like [Pteropus vampyrus]